jgi:hypothetical protein
MSLLRFGQGAAQFIAGTLVTSMGIGTAGGGPPGALVGLAVGVGVVGTIGVIWAGAAAIEWLTSESGTENNGKALPNGTGTLSAEKLSQDLDELLKERGREESTGLEGK